MKPIMSVDRTIGGVSNRVMARHPYFESGVVASSAAAEVVFTTYRLRSVYDPDLTGTGHQPRGRDNYVAYGYTHYKVHGCTVELKMMNNKTESDYAGQTFACYLTGASDPFIDAEALHELGSCGAAIILKRKWMPPYANTGSIGHQSQMLGYKGYIGALWNKAKRFNFDNVGPQAVEYFDHNSYTVVGNNPDVNTDVYLTMAAFGPGQAVTEAQGFMYWLKFTYYVEWIFMGEPAES